MRLFPSILVIVCMLLAGGYSLRSSFDRSKSAATKLSFAKKELAAARNETDRLENANAETFAALARGRTFLREWQVGQQRGLRGGIDNMVAELSSVLEVIPTTPKFDHPSTYLVLPESREGIPSRRLSVTADGKAENLLLFYSELERSLPLSVAHSVVLRGTEREPRLEIEMQVLDRAFAELPDFTDSPLEASASGIFAARPESTRSVLPTVSPTLIARGVRSSTVTNVRATARELSAVLPTLKVTGVLWDLDEKKRRLIANGSILRPFETVPAALVDRKSATRVRLIRIFRDRAIFEVESDEVNPVNGQNETTSREATLTFALYEGITSEG